MIVSISVKFVKLKLKSVCTHSIPKRDERVLNEKYSVNHEL